MKYGLLIAALLSAGCYTTRLDVRPATPPAARSNSIVIDRPRAEVWAKGIPVLAKRFFVINNIDQSSGLLNVSYSGDPQRYVVGPDFTYAVEHPIPETSSADATGEERNAPEVETTTTFHGTQAVARYSVVQGMVSTKVTRTTSLDGRANIVLEALSPAKTLVTVTVKYLLSVNYSGSGFETRPADLTRTIVFNTGGKGSFDIHPDAFYYSTGELESELLAAFE